MDSCSTSYITLLVWVTHFWNWEYHWISPLGSPRGTMLLELVLRTVIWYNIFYILEVPWSSNWPSATLFPSCNSNIRLLFFSGCRDLTSQWPIFNMKFVDNYLRLTQLLPEWLLELLWTFHIHIQSTILSLPLRCLKCITFLSHHI